MPNRDQRRRDGTFEYAQLDLAPASDEPARCEHDWDFMQPASTCRRCGAEWADTQTSPAATTPAPECRHCNGSGNAHTFDGADLGICGTCHGTGSAAGGGL